MKQVESWGIKYIRYNNPSFIGHAFAGSKEDAERIAQRLGKLKHVSQIEINKL